MILGSCRRGFEQAAPTSGQARLAGIDEQRSEFPATLWTGTIDPSQVLEQAYFAGVHCDVGGSYPEHGLADITLGWMMSKAKALGVQFDAATWQRLSQIDPKHALDTKHESWNILWLFPRRRSIAPNAAIGNSVNIRLEFDESYRPKNLHENNGVLDPTYHGVGVISNP